MGVPDSAVSFDDEKQIELATVRAEIAYNNENLNIQNEGLISNGKWNGFTVVIQVHNRLDLLRELLTSVSLMKGAEQSLLIISMDTKEDKIINEIEQFNHCATMVIYHPYSMQFFNDQYPATDRRDCTRAMGFNQCVEPLFNLPFVKYYFVAHLTLMCYFNFVLSLKPNSPFNTSRSNQLYNSIQDQKQNLENCNSAAKTDSYGHFREAKFSQIKLHWTWKLNFIYAQVKKYKIDSVILLEEDHYLSTDALHVAQKLIVPNIRTCEKSSKICLGSLGTYFKPNQKVSSLIP